MKFKDYKNFVTDSGIYGIQNSINNTWIYIFGNKI